mgnify:CR=1 FL=1
MKPMGAMKSMDAMDPVDRMDPVDAMDPVDRMEPLDGIEAMDELEGYRERGRRRRRRAVRVAIFSDALPERNGAGSYYEDLVDGLSASDVRIEIFQPARKRRWPGLAIPMPWDSTQRLVLPDVARVMSRYGRLRPDLVLSVTPGPFGLLGLAQARAHGTPFLTGFHTHFERLVGLYGGGLGSRLAHEVLDGLHRMLCRGSRAVLVHNEDLVDTVRRLGAREVEVMGTPLASVFLEKPVARPTGTLDRVIFAGRLAPEKNLPAILEAARALPEIEFVLCGDGPLRSEVEGAARALPNLRSTGWLDRTALREELDAADLLLLPSHIETFGTVALEAMARGRPALVASSAGILRWPELTPALFQLEEDVPLARALRRLRTLPPVVWIERARIARRAAEKLHRRTLAQWIACFDRHTEIPDEA